MKVLGGMFSLDNVVLPNFLASKLAVLSSYGITFGRFIANIEGDYFTLVWILGVFLFILLFKNSNQWAKDFRANKKIALFTALILSFGILSLTKVSEFLYFNF